MPPLTLTLSSLSCSSFSSFSGKSKEKKEENNINSLSLHLPSFLLFSSPPSRFFLFPSSSEEDGAGGRGCQVATTRLQWQSGDAEAALSGDRVDGHDKKSGDGDGVPHRRRRKSTTLAAAR